MARFTTNSRRFDPYKNFKLRIAASAVIGAAATLLLIKVLKSDKD